MKLSQIGTEDVTVDRDMWAYSRRDTKKQIRIKICAIGSYLGYVIISLFQKH